MRLLHALPSSFYGGPEKQILLSSETLRASYGHTSSFLIQPGRGQTSTPFGDMLESRGFNVRYSRGGALDLLRSRQDLRKAVAETRADVLVTYGYRFDLAQSTRRKTIPWISVVHGWTGASARVRWFESIDRLALRRADAVVPIARSQIPLIKNAGVAPHRIHCIPNAYDPGSQPPARSREEIAKLLDLPLGSRWVGSVGRLSPEKGHRFLLRAFAETLKTLPNIYLVLVGNGPELAALKDLAGDLGIAPKIRFAGFQADGGAWIGAMDLLVLPSLREAFPLVLLESFAYGTPLLATAVGDATYLIKDNETGWLCPPGDAASLRDGIVSALASAESARVIANRARELLERECGPEPQGRLWNQVLLNI